MIFGEAPTRVPTRTALSGRRIIQNIVNAYVPSTSPALNLRSFWLILKCNSERSMGVSRRPRSTQRAQRCRRGQAHNAKPVLRIANVTRDSTPRRPANMTSCSTRSIARLTVNAVVDVIARRTQPRARGTVSYRLHGDRAVQHCHRGIVGNPYLHELAH